MSEKAIVLYYSSSSNTHKIATMIGQLANIEVEEILPVHPYTTEYEELTRVAKREISEGDFPKLQPLSRNLKEYDTIYLGTPNWWSTLACPITTFLMDNDVSGKVIRPFVTHGGGGLAHIEKDIKALCKTATVASSLVLYEDGGKQAKETVKHWLKEE